MSSRTKRPTVQVRNAYADDTAKMVEASAPSGAGLKVGFHATVDGGALYVSPYRADRDVYLFVKRSHAADCEVFTSRAESRRCDCGSCFTYNAASGDWEPTRRHSVQP
ncbi:MAG TPA: hypothetical protein VGG39_23495 [Polyangiaceae bacterium]|jgi:hypothetical protein